MYSSKTHLSSNPQDQRYLRAVRAAPVGARFSTGDVLKAFIWQRFFWAKYLPDALATIGTHGDPGTLPAESTISYAADIRQRLSPPLPHGFLGAAVDSFRVKMSGRALIGQHQHPHAHQSASEDLADLALAIRKTNRDWNREQYQALLNVSLRAPRRPAFIPRGPRDLLFTDHMRAGLLVGTNWGPGLGKTVAFREPYLNRVLPAGEVTMFPRWPNGDIEVMITAETVVLERLAADKEMARESVCQFLRHDVVERVRKMKGRETKL
jgi:hypothetical protein